MPNLVVCVSRKPICREKCQSHSLARSVVVDPGATLELDLGQ
jgi:hypothetical protein